PYPKLPLAVARLARLARDDVCTGTRPSRLLVLVPHEHQCCTCGRQFCCTAPSCAGRTIPCVCCRLDRIERRLRGWAKPASRSKTTETRMPGACRTAREWEEHNGDRNAWVSRMRKRVGA